MLQVQLSLPLPPQTGLSYWGLLEACFVASARRLGERRRAESAVKATMLAQVLMQQQQGN